MADQNRDWLAHQARASVMWLESLPPGALSPTGVSLCNRAKQWLVVLDAQNTPLRVVADSQGGKTVSKAERGGTPEDMQPPLMMDLPSLK